MDAKIFALTVGIGRYVELPALTCPPNDARDFATVVHRSVIPSEVKVLTDADATKDSILNEFAWLAQASRSSDTTVLFFSGHGGRQGPNREPLLCPVDAQAAHLEQTCLSGDEISRALRAIKSDRLIVFLDTCYSGAFVDLPGDMGIAAGVTQSNIDAMVEGRGRMIVAASQPNSATLESATMRNGAFSTYLLRALQGDAAQADGRVWASDVFSFVAHRMRRHHFQSVYQKAVGDNFVVLAHDRRQLAPIVLTSTASQRALRLAMLGAYDRADLSRLCTEIGLDIEHLPGRTLENQMLNLIDFCHRHGLRDRLLEFIYADHPELFAAV